jgi:hypothetical protein
MTHTLQLVQVATPVFVCICVFVCVCVCMHVCACASACARACVEQLVRSTAAPRPRVNPPAGRRPWISRDDEGVSCGNPWAGLSSNQAPPSAGGRRSPGGLHAIRRASIIPCKAAQYTGIAHQWDRGPGRVALKLDTRLYDASALLAGPHRIAVSWKVVPRRALFPEPRGSTRRAKLPAQCRRQASAYNTRSRLAWG